MQPPPQPAPQQTRICPTATEIHQTLCCVPTSITKGLSTPHAYTSRKTYRSSIAVSRGRKPVKPLQWISVALKKYGSCGFRTELGKRVHITCQITWDWTALQPLVSVCPYVRLMISTAISFCMSVLSSESLGAMEEDDDVSTWWNDWG